MRWIPFLLLVYVTVIVQATVGAVFSIPVGSLVLRIDFMAALAVAVALRVRSGTDAILVGWVIGFALDVASPDWPTGLWAMSFALAGGMVYRIREAVFGENPFTQVLMGFLFYLCASVLGLLFIRLRVPERSHLGRDLATALLVAICTAAVSPVVCRLVGRVAPWILVQPLARRRR